MKNSASCTSAMKLLGDYWTLRIIDALSSGELRFCALQRMTDNLNPVTLTSRLKNLEEARLIHRTEEIQDKISVSYSLTALGRETLPVISALNKFAQKAEKVS